MAENGKAATYRICQKCVMDTSDPLIIFDENGVCSNCHRYASMATSWQLSIEASKRKLDEIVSEIKDAGRGKPYDCVAGISGGVDSCYTALAAKTLGLRPLIVHFDNGWNTEIAVRNVHNIVENLGLDMETYVVDWEEYKDLQLAYLKASVINLEAPTDHAITAVVNKYAAKYNVKYILSGSNFVTEAILPESWGYSNMDLRNILAIHKRYGQVRLRSFPRFGIPHRIWYQLVLGIQSVRILDLLPYNRETAKAILTSELGWKDYGGKHHESIITRFYQAYILPRKFGIDKRKAHLSTMICSGQITRGDALRELKSGPYQTDSQMEDDRAFVAKKFDMTVEELMHLIDLPTQPHSAFSNNAVLYSVIRKLTTRVWRNRPLYGN
jgi:N-acetyl sugar amidotransferase